MKARDLMTPNPEFVTSDDSLTQAARIMRDVDVGIVPVVDDPMSMRVMGVITDRDIAVRHVAEGHQQECRVADHMTSGQIDCVSPDADEDEVLERMEREQIRRLPVVEEDNRLVGIIAQADLATRGVKEKKVGEVVERISEPGEPQR
ncbi:MAG TPA: CBS domain-containing protein [Longimicrobiales bacterium]